MSHWASQDWLRVLLCCPYDKTRLTWNQNNQLNIHVLPRSGLARRSLRSQRTRQRNFLPSRQLCQGPGWRRRRKRSDQGRSLFPNIQRVESPGGQRIWLHFFIDFSIIIQFFLSEICSLFMVQESREFLMKICDLIDFVFLSTEHVGKSGVFERPVEPSPEPMQVWFQSCRSRVS